MGTCCSSGGSSGGGRKGNRQNGDGGAEQHAALQAAVEGLVTLIPGAHFGCLLTKHGTVIALVSTRGDAESAELAGVVASVKRAALQFARSLGQTACPVMRISGARNTLSCYGVGDEHLLAFYAEHERGLGASGRALALETAMDNAQSDPVADDPACARAMAVVRSQVASLETSGQH